MNDKFFVQQPIRPISQPLTKSREKSVNKDPQGNFRAILDKQLTQNQELKFSKHAQERLNLRNIRLN